MARALPLFVPVNTLAPLGSYILLLSRRSSQNLIGLPLRAVSCQPLVLLALHYTRLYTPSGEAPLNAILLLLLLPPNTQRCRSQ